jgi:hypothetical protein
MTPLDAIDPIDDRIHKGGHDGIVARCEFGRTGSAEGGDEDGLDGVEPVLGLVEDDAGG